MGRIKLLYLVNTLNVGGTEQRVVKLLETLPRDVFDLHLCCLVEKGFMYDRVEKAGVPVYVLGYTGVRKNGKLNPFLLFQFPSLFYKFYKYLKNGKFDVMHTFLPISNTVGAVVGSLAGVPRIVASRVFTGEYRDVNPLYKHIENYAASKADSIVCNSKLVVDDVLKRENAPKEKLKIIYNGVDVEKIQKNDRAKISAQIRSEFGIPADVLIVGVVANLHAYKGLDNMIKAASIILNSRKNVHFVFVGRDVGMLEPLKSLAAELNISGNMHFAGFRDNVHELVSGFDIQAMSSLEEGLPNAILEGMAAGNAFVATNAGGCEEAVTDGITGYIVPKKNPEALAEKLMLLINDPEKRKAMGEAGLKNAREHFSLESMIKSYGDIYIELANKRK